MHDAAVVTWSLYSTRRVTYSHHYHQHQPQQQGWPHDVTAYTHTHTRSHTGGACRPARAQRRLLLQRTEATRPTHVTYRSALSHAWQIMFISAASTFFLTFNLSTSAATPNVRLNGCCAVKAACLSNNAITTTPNPFLAHIMTCLCCQV